MKASLDATSDIAANRQYFLGQLKLSVLIAIDSTRQRPNDDPSAIPDYESDRIGGFFAVTSFPTFYLIDRKGVIRERFFGYNEETINRSIERLLAEPAEKAGE